MMAPIIPGLNHHEIPQILKMASQSGACTAAYTVLRLNGAIGDLMKDWLEKNFPDRANKVWNQVSSLHNGVVNDSTWGRRMRGEGRLAEIIKKLFEVSRKQYFSDRKMPEYDTEQFRRGGNLRLF
jgi:DNA repair photolyase